MAGGERGAARQGRSQRRRLERGERSHPPAGLGATLGLTSWRSGVGATRRARGCAGVGSARGCAGVGAARGCAGVGAAWGCAGVGAARRAARGCAGVGGCATPSGMGSAHPERATSGLGGACWQGPRGREAISGP